MQEFSGLWTQIFREVIAKLKFLELYFEFRFLTRLPGDLSSQHLQVNDSYCPNITFNTKDIIK